MESIYQRGFDFLQKQIRAMAAQARKNNSQIKWTQRLYALLAGARHQVLVSAPITPYLVLVACHALSTYTNFLPSLDAKRTITAAYRESLRKQLRRRSPAPERDSREARVARFRQYSGLHRE